MLLLGEILLSILAVFGLYVLLRRLFVAHNEIAIVARRRSGASKEQRLRLVERAYDDAWLCGSCRVVLLDECERELTVEEFLK